MANFPTSIFRSLPNISRPTQKLGQIRFPLYLYLYLYLPIPIPTHPSDSLAAAAIAGGYRGGLEIGTRKPQQSSHRMTTTTTTNPTQPNPIKKNPEMPNLNNNDLGTDREIESPFETRAGGVGVRCDRGGSSGNGNGNSNGNSTW